MKEHKLTIICQLEDTLINTIYVNLQGSKKKTVKNYIIHNMVKVNSKTISNPNFKVKTNDEIILYFDKKGIPNYKIDIIYEDKDLIAINKPSGLLSISNDKEKEITAFRLVSDYLKKDNPKAKLFVVHRLDEDTSGVLLFSKNLKLKEYLQDNWQELVKTREYICVVEGKIPSKGTITSYLTVNHFQMVHSTKNKEIGKLAITNYEVIKYKNNLSLVRVLIDTGRRNQIRVHMSEMGHPIVGDKKYGSKNNAIKRLALHATKLELLDKRVNKILTLEVPVPKEIENLVK